MSLFAVSVVQYMEKQFLPFIFVLFVCFAHICSWLLINQIRMDIRSRDWVLVEEEERQQENEDPPNAKGTVEEEENCMEV